MSLDLLLSRAPTRPDPGLTVSLPDVGALNRALVYAFSRACPGPVAAFSAEHCRDSTDLKVGALQGGWMVLLPDWERWTSLADAVVVARTERAGVVVFEGSTTLSADDRARLAEIEATALAAGDPALARVRRVLQALVDQGETVVVRGPPGSGRASLAQLVLGTRVSVLDTTERNTLYDPARALLVRDADQLDPAAIHSLITRLHGQHEGVSADRPVRRRTPPAFQEILGVDAGLVGVLEEAAIIAPSPLSVLILGETGTGKEPLAHAIHTASGRRGKFVTLDLASRSHNLAEDDLFGHVPGAFEGARAGRDGAARAAHGGTLFLDEIGNLSLSLQARLLRLVERGEVQPLGADQVHRVDIRLIAATNVDLEAMARAGSFRWDLYQRLAGVVLRLPPLRARGEDVIRLATAFVAEKGHTLGPDVLDTLRSWAWPGNVRELRQRMFVACARARQPVLSAADIDLPTRRAPTVVSLTQLPSAFPPRAAQALAALTLELPPLGARPFASLAAAARFHLFGRPIRPDALAAVAHAPWYGEGVELARRLGTLHRGLPPGPLDLPTLRDWCGELGRGRRPLELRLHPVRREDGGVAGLSASVEAPAVVIGRARGRADLEPDVRRWLTQHAAEVGFFSLPLPTELSRLHVLVCREGAGLRVFRGPHSRLAVRVNGEEIASDEGLLGGDTLCLTIGDTLCVWVAADTVAMDRAMAQLPAPSTQLDATAGKPPRSTQLNDDEVELLARFIVDWLRTSDDFAPSLRRAAHAPPWGELRELLLSSHPTQTCGRLYLSPTNHPLRLRTVELLRAEGLELRAHDRLPQHILRSLSALGETQGLADTPTSDPRSARR